MLFNQQVFHLEYVFPFDSFWYLRLHELLLFFYQITASCCLENLSSKIEEITLLHEFIFVFIQCFNGAILSEKSCIEREVAADAREEFVYRKGI